LVGEAANKKRQPQGNNMSFRDFVLKGNVMDLAVGVIIGGAFGKIVDSLVNDLINPIIGRIIGTPDFSSFYIPLATIPAEMAGKPYAEIAKAVPLFGIGAFATVVINFLLLALVIYYLVKYTQGLSAKFAPPPAPPAGPSDEVKLLTEIRDSLKK
jgi:large conductance mechanosensitive channel